MGDDEQKASPGHLWEVSSIPGLLEARQKLAGIAAAAMARRNAVLRAIQS